MKILFLTDNFPPEVNPPATRTMKNIKEWVKKDDIHITVITCFPNYPKGKVYSGYKNKFYTKETIEDGKITLIRVWSYMAANSGVVKRILDQLSYAIMSLFFGLFQKYDIIIATSPQFFTTWSAFFLSKIKRKPWVFELRDLWPESIEALGVIRNKSVLSILESIELFLYNDAKIVISLTKAFKENLISRGISPNKIHVITNGVDSEIYSPKVKNHKLIEKLNLKNKFVVGYYGTHGISHALDFIIESNHKMSDNEFHFLFVGDGAEKNSLLQLSKKYKLENITFIDTVGEESLLDYISICNIGLVNLKKNDAFVKVIPSKLFNLASMKKPILLGVDGEARKILEQYNAGVFFEPENYQSFKENLLLLKDNHLVYNTCKEGCTSLANAYNHKKLANKMLDIIKER